MSPRLKQKILGLVVASALAALAFYVNRDRAGEIPSATGGDAASGFETLTGCSLVPWGGNDGDSFKVRHDGGESVFRTYFVDCPEKGLGSRADIRDSMRRRVRYQSEYFNNLSDEQVFTVGKEGRDFTIELLERSTFTVQTKWERVMGGERFFAFVLVEEAGPEGTKPEFLSKILVREGLARIYGKPSDHPDGTTEDRWKADLRALEAQARNAGRGAWRFSER